MRGIWILIKTSVNEFFNDDCPTMAAALSYYTVFSLPPLLYLVIKLTAIFLDPSDVRGKVEYQITNLIGSRGTEAVQAMLEHVDKSESTSLAGTVLGVCAVLLGATAAFVQLQEALNRAWSVGPDPKRGELKAFMGKRILSFGIILMLAFLLLVSLVVSAAISAFGDYLARMFPALISDVLLQAINFGVSLIVIGSLFALIFKFLPDAVLAWRDIWVGAGITALLFVLGKTLIGLYLGNSDPVSAYGAAGSLAVVFVWIYYSSMIVLLGAEFTEVWASTHGTRIRPERGAVRVIREYRTEDARTGTPFPGPGQNRAG